MALHIKNTVKSSASSENRIEPGKIVEYDQHSKPLLAVTLSEKKGKWRLLNQGGAELELGPDRLYLLPGAVPPEFTTTQQRAAFLASLTAEAEKLASSLDLEEVWSVLLGERDEVSVRDIAEIALGENNILNHLATRRALTSDRVFFKRRKNGFEPRPEETVAELKLQAKAEDEKQNKKEAFYSAVVKKLRGENVPLPEELSVLELAAALGRSYARANEAKELLEEVGKRANLDLGGKLEQRAFSLLVKLKHFRPDENLAPLRLGRPVRFSPDVLSEADRIAGGVPPSGNRRDCRSLFTITIDGAETRDFDDALSIEKTASGTVLGIHISDVSAFIAQGSPLDDCALRRATSVYLPDEQIPMLPHAVSENSLSLVEGSERPVMSFFLDYDANGTLQSKRIERTTITISKRLTYEQADGILADSSSSGSLATMLQALWDITARSEGRRMEAGAIQFMRSEMIPRVHKDGSITLEPAAEDTPARKLVGEMMILANEAAASFAAEENLPLIFRAQEPPDVNLEEQGLDIIEGEAREFFRRGFIKRSTTQAEAAGHIGLGLTAYTHITSPIRRAVDLINQRQLAHFLERKQAGAGEALYSAEEIMSLIAQLETGLDEANQIQRERVRYWQLKYLQQEKIKELDAIILRVDGVKPLAEVDVLHSIFPYFPLSSHTKGSQLPRSFLGRKVRLAVESINPAACTVVLREL